MTYPRNAANPDRLAIGPVVQISDGAVQTSGVAVKVIPFGDTEASGGGTVAYSADGVVLYTPTQAETNHTSFVLVASKAACLPASVTIVTSAQATAGLVQVGGYASGQAPPAVTAVADEVQTRTIARVTLCDTVTTNTDMRGTDNAPTAEQNAAAVVSNIRSNSGGEAN